MSEIEKMYENAGIKPTHYDACALADKYWNNEELAIQYCTFDGYLSFECPHRGEGCYSTCEYAYDKDEYPPFTAEKQLELIKLLGNCKGYPDYEGFGADFDFYAQLYEFKTALVKSINDRWQYLADDLKQQIKEILK